MSRQDKQLQTRLLITLLLGVCLSVFALVFYGGSTTSPPNLGMGAVQAGSKDLSADHPPVNQPIRPVDLTRTGTEASDPWAKREGESLTTEQDYYKVLIELFRTDPTAFAELAEASLREGVAIAAQRAALRAWHDMHRDDPYDLYIKVLSSTNEATALRSFAQEFLDHQAASKLTARNALVDLINTRPADPTVRSAAFFSILRWGRDDEIHKCMTLVLSEQQPKVVERAAQGLASSQELGAQANLSDLKRTHPNSEVRAYLQERFGK